MDNSLLHTFFSHGKLLITGEYLVLKGALSLAVPTRAGQSMHVYKRLEKSENTLLWETTVQGKDWFRAEFSIQDFSILTTTHTASAAYISGVLQGARTLYSGFLCDDIHSALYVQCNIEFDNQWGLGSSSSLIANVAQWSGVDPLALHKACTKGSGYDVAVAQKKTAILYQLKDSYIFVNDVNFNPRFKEMLFFAYVGKKQNSYDHVVKFLSSQDDFSQFIYQINELTRRISTTDLFTEFEDCMVKHEEIIAKVTGYTPVKQLLFSDFKGAVKSLGAWGGDFILLTWQGSKSELQTYLKTKNITTVFGFDEILIS